MNVGKILVILGLTLVAAGLLWQAGEWLGLGRLPGDIVLRGERWTLYFPLATSLVLSILLTLVLWVLRR
ncbi:MAG: DUF2905 domain-containing protein [Gemmataceae bacterium]|nr:DUF2905 domain-containing protein [Gemmataceae bacterium]MDW8265502.1 DUF2905 domain-containing protein [Gemmataceae bacterium]